MKKISVIMGVYNCGDKQTLSRCIGSIIDQNYSNWEFIICDDGSTDTTWNLLKEWEEKDKRIRVIHNEHNMTLAPTLNKCIQKASGDYIARMDADDWASENRFMEQIQFLETHLDIDFCGSDAILFDEDGEWGKRTNKAFPQKSDFLRTVPFVHPSIMARKSFFERYQYSEDNLYRRCEDYELFMRAYADGRKGANIRRPLMYYNESRMNGKKMSFLHRIKAVKVRTIGFWQLGLFPKAALFVFKPLLSGLIPRKIVLRIKREDFMV